MHTLTQIHSYTYTHTHTLTETDALPSHHPFGLICGEKEWKPNVIILDIYYYY